MRRLAVVSAALAAAAVLAAAGALGYWVLLHPANPLTAYFSSKISETDARVVTGPYPMRADLEKLRAAGVQTVVSLLDPAIPYENNLLEKERKSAAELGLIFFNFPMGSILGQRFGDGYERNAAGAAKAVKEATGKVYVHCYLGMHRIKVVLAMMEGSGESSAAYIRKGERAPDALALDRAQAFFEKGSYEAALAEISSIKSAGPAAVLLRGWCLFRLGRIAPASEAFAAALKADPSLLGARAGLGYCALREGDAKRAVFEFTAVLDARPEDSSALFGLGLARKRQGRDKDAAALFERALAKDPDNKEARDALGSVRARQ